MGTYSKEVIEEYALWSHVRIILARTGAALNGWLVPNPNDGTFMKSTYALLEDDGGVMALERSHIRTITYLNNNFTLPKKIKGKMPRRLEK